MKTFYGRDYTVQMDQVALALYIPCDPDQPDASLEVNIQLKSGNWISLEGEEASTFWNQWTAARTQKKA